MSNRHRWREYRKALEASGRTMEAQCALLARGMPADPRDPSNPRWEGPLPPTHEQIRAFLHQLQCNESNEFTRQLIEDSLR